jgi:hypothetical protein
MKKVILSSFGLFILSVVTHSVSAQTLPRVFLLDAQKLQQVKQSIKAGDKSYGPALAKLEAEAKSALKSDVYSVTSKTAAPPSGDKRDYMSQAPYFWPDPKSPNGLPYIRKDGERNPEIEKYPDHEIQDKMISAVETLAWAYYFTNDEVYAAKAVRFLRAWYLDPATKMNPNLEYAQAIPGVNTGRGIGLIETRNLPKVVDAIGMLDGSKSLTDADKKGLQDWYGKFLQWMLESKNGKDEAASKNNHGTYYDAQIVSFALFVGKKDLAKGVLETAKQKRIALQVETDGRQPLELERTKGWSYSVMNLDGLMTLADLGESAGVDLWNYQTSDGRGIRRALEFLYPFSVGEKWKYQQIEGFQPSILFPLMRRAAAKYTDDKFKTMTAKIPATNQADREFLTYAELPTVLKK